MGAAEPLRVEGQEVPDRAIERAGEIGDRGIGRRNDAELPDDRGDIGNHAAQSGGVACGCATGDKSAGKTCLSGRVETCIVGSAAGKGATRSAAGDWGQEEFVQGRDCVIGVYDGYPSIDTEKGGLRLFLASLRQVNRTCKVVVICRKSAITDDLSSLCRTHDAEIFSNFEIPDGIYMMQFRFHIYRHCLRSLGDKYALGQVLMADMNDVFFQGDPFGIPYEEDFYVACEGARLDDEANAASVLNMRWIGAGHPGSPRDFDGCHVACAGTILGRYAPAIAYLDWYLAQQLRSRFRFNDQGLWNRYVHVEAPHVAKRKDLLSESLILTLDQLSWRDLRPRDDRFVNGKGQFYAILHQIDRVPEVLAHVRALIGAAAMASSGSRTARHADRA